VTLKTENVKNKYFIAFDTKLFIGMQILLLISSVFLMRNFQINFSACPEKCVEVFPSSLPLQTGV